MKTPINGLIVFCLIFVVLFFIIGCIGNIATNDNKEIREIKETNEIKKITEKAGLANPASVFCEKNGGKLEIVNEPEGQKGICTLSTGEKCEEWAYLRGECPTKKETETHLCTPESRKAEVCMTLYDPVCGWFSQKIKCVRYPCAVTASNACEVCKNENVESWTQGECPK